MRRRVATVLAFVAVALAAAGAARANTVRATALRSVQFPDRAFILATAVPTALDTHSVRVLENGELVAGATVVPASATATSTFGAVVVLDASESMAGAPIRGAVAAARTFAAHKSRHEAVGVVAFNSSVSVLSPLSDEVAAVQHALRRNPRLAQGTYLYDAAARAIDLLRAKRIAAGSVVLLTDGSDTGSRLTRAALVARARAAGVRIFAVGLRSSQFRPGALKALATATGGSYAEASSTKRLGAIYGQLSRRLASEHLLRYRSVAPPGTTVSVEISIPGVAAPARWSYRTTGVPTGASGPFHRSLVARFVDSSRSALVISTLAALLVAFAVWHLLGRRRGDLRQRIESFVTAGPDRPAEDVAETARRPAFDVVDRALAGTDWWTRFKEEVDVAGVDTSAGGLLVGCALATIVALLLLAAISPLLAPFAVLVPLAGRAAVRARVRSRRELFADQLPDNLLVLAASLRAGHSFAGALSAVLEEADEPSRSELGRAVADERIGVPVEAALLAVSRRMDNPDLEQVALVAALQRETGGNTAEVLDTVVETVRERFELRRLVHTLTAQGRLSKWILMFLPLGVAGIVGLVNPTYLTPLFTTSTGHILLAIAITLQAVGFVLIRRILDVRI